MTTLVMVIAAEVAMSAEVALGALAVEVALAVGRRPPVSVSALRTESGQSG